MCFRNFLIQDAFDVPRVARQSSARSNASFVRRGNVILEFCKSLAAACVEYMPQAGGYSRVLLVVASVVVSDEKSVRAGYFTELRFPFLRVIILPVARGIFIAD